MTRSLRNAVIVGGNRIPFARSGTAYADATTQQLLAAALNGLVARFGLSGEKIDEVAAGAVVKHPRDFNLTREAVLDTSLDPHTPAVDIQQACATSLETFIYAANKIQLGQANTAITGGVDSTSDAPLSVSEGLKKALMKASRAKSLQDKLKAFASVRPKDLAPVPPGIKEPRTGMSMGESQSQTGDAYGISREAQDEIAYESHQRLARAWDEGFFDDLVTPFNGLTRDNVLRPDTSPEKLAKLRPAFGATMTAGNSTSMTDGAAAVLLADEDTARNRGWTPLAKFVDAQVAAVDHACGEEETDGLLLAPTRAIPEILERNGLTTDDIDLFEIHEAFASTVLTTLKRLENLGITIDKEKINIDGSSLAAGHPFAATGARILAGLSKRLHERGPGSRGLISVCAAGGQGVVVILEAI